MQIVSDKALQRCNVIFWPDFWVELWVRGILGGEFLEGEFFEGEFFFGGGGGALLLEKKAG